MFRLRRDVPARQKFVRGREKNEKNFAALRLCAKKDFVLRERFPCFFYRRFARKFRVLRCVPWLKKNEYYARKKSKRSIYFPWRKILTK